MFIKQLNKRAIALALIIIAPLAMANDDCVKPKVKGYNTDEMRCIGEGLVSIYRDNGSMVFDKNGKIVLSAGRYDYVFEASAGLIGVGKSGYAMVGFISQSTGKEVIPLNYVSTGEAGVHSFSEGLVLMKNSAEKFGYLDNKGHTIIPFSFTSAEDFSEGLAAVGKGEHESSKQGYIDKTGSTVIPLIYDAANSFSEGLATVRKGDYDTGKYGVIDKQGKIILPLKYDSYIGQFSEGLAIIINKKDGHGFIDRSGKLVIPYKYVIETYEGELPAFKNGKVAVTGRAGTGDYYCINKANKRVTC